VQADERRVKTQGGIVWMALAMMVTTRLWLGGEGSAQRDMTLIRRLIERVRRWAARRPLLICPDGLCSYIRAMRETFRDPVQTGKGGRPRLRPWRNICIAQVVKRYERRRVVATDRRMVEGTPARVETLRCRSQGDGVINTAYMERLHATFRARLAPLARRCRALARQTLTRHEGMFVVGTVYNLCTPHTSVSQTQKMTPAMAAGITDHGWTLHELLSCHVPLPRWAPPGIHVKRDNRRSIAYSEELIFPISATLQSTDRHHGIVGQEYCHFQRDSCIRPTEHPEPGGSHWPFQK